MDDTSNIDARQSQIGVIGDGARVEGGIHFYDAPPPSKALSLHQLPPDACCTAAVPK